MIVAASSDSGVSEAVQRANPVKQTAAQPSTANKVIPMWRAASPNIATPSSASSPAVQRRLSPMSQTSQY
jgi:hypothetical protein